MGGLSLGLALALEGAGILGLDVDRWAVETYNLNLSRLGCRAEVQDVLAWEPRGEFDVVVGGSPCQPFSLANTKRRGEAHPLFPTFPRFFDAVLALRPKAFVMENVKGLTLRPFRRYLEAQLRRASELYRVWTAVLDAALYGVPQRRERLFVVGVRRGLGAGFEFPRQTHAPWEHAALDGGRVRRWLTLREAIGDLMALPPLDGDLTPLAPEQAGRIMREREDVSRHWGRMAFPDSLEEPSRTLSSHTVEGAKRETIVLPLPLRDHVSGSDRPMTEGQLERYRRRWRERAGESKGTVLFMDSRGEVVEVPWTPYQSKHPLLRPDEPPSAVVSHLAKSSRHSLVPEELPATAVQGDARLWPPGHHGLRRVVYRRVTVRECLRIQSFPDWWRFPDGCAVSKRYRLVGEAVPPVLAYRLGLALGRALGLPTRWPPREEEWALPYFGRAFPDAPEGA
jgi:DNA (cytosine-5)-methyltransferase 1